MNKSIISVDKDDTIRLAVKKMIQGDLGSVIVTDNNKPVGMLTERDILRYIYHEKINLNDTAQTIMTNPLISVDINATIDEAAQIMLTNNIRRLLVKEKDEYVGIISQRELQKSVSELS
ncbi:MAG: cyclic nucleotide-binding/CBS domain-containing protein [Nitrososphaeraceae archaeon]